MSYGNLLKCKKGVEQPELTGTDRLIYSAEAPESAKTRHGAEQRTERGKVVNSRVQNPAVFPPIRTILDLI